MKKDNVSLKISCSYHHCRTTKPHNIPIHEKDADYLLTHFRLLIAPRAPTTKAILLQNGRVILCLQWLRLEKRFLKVKEKILRIILGRLENKFPPTANGASL